ncbi:RND transporter, partial [Pseudomonas syringae pv. actinidiae]|nr:RND transporter [Pseudomonas syringae pv. actinidiae]
MSRRIIRGLRPLGILALTLVISACVATHGIKQQGSVLPVDRLATDQAIQSAARDAHWPAAQWWRAYGDAQLDRWIELATLGSPSLALL